MEISQRIDAALRAANIPIDGVAALDDGSFRVDYLASATHAQQLAGAAIVKATPKMGRKPVSFAVLRAQIVALSVADRNTLLIAVAIDFLQNNPTAARRLGIALDGDQDEI